MDPFNKFLIFWIFCILIQRRYGWKFHSYEPYHGSSKSVLEKADSNPPTISDSTGKTIEMKVGEHLVKVRSEKEPLSSASESDEHGSSINPKYSHVIEIIRRGDNLEKEDKLAEINEGKQESVELTKTVDSEDGDNEIEGNPKESDETGEFNEDMHEELNETEEEFNEAEEEIPDEFEETEDEFSEAEEEISDESEETEDEFNEAEEEIPDESEETEDEFSEAEEEIPDESEETEDEFSEAEEEIPDESEETEDEFSEAEEEIPDESEETEDEFSEAEEEIPDEYEETEDEFSEADEDIPDETEEEFIEAEEDIPDESEETEEEFSETEEEIPEKSDETEEEFSEDDGEIPDKSDESDNGDIETDEEEFESNEKGPGKTDENIPIRFGEADKKDSDGTENPKTFAVGANSDEENKTSNEKDNEELQEVFEGSGEEFTDINDRNSTKTGRILGMFSRRNETFPACTTPRGEAGHCRRLGECLLSEALNNFNGFLQQLCLIRGVRVGICCPDNPVVETLNPDENVTNALAPEEIKQPPEGCGLNTKTRIVGGSISVPHEWTWMVALMRRNRFYCGGVIINNWYILTAAHCVMGMNVKDLSVRLGEYDFNEESKHTEDFSVSEIKRHAQFVTLTFQHDIALLKLKRSIKYSKFVGSICLPDQKARDYSDVNGTVVGWGTVSFGGAASPVLRQVTVPVWKNEDCDKTYLLESIGESFMCAGSPERGEDACQGDSGGPLMTVNESGRWEVIGLVSWGRRCGDPTYPGVYTRVTTYLDWIKQNAV